MKRFMQNVKCLFNIRKSIISKLFVCFLTFTLVLVIMIMIIWKSNVENTVTKLTASHMRDVVQNTNNRFENDMYSLASIMTQLAHTNVVYDYLESDISPSEATDYLQNTYNVLTDRLNGIAAISENKVLSVGKLYLPTGTDKQSWYKSILESERNVVLFQRSKNTGQPFECFSLGTKVLNSYNEPVGVLIFSFNARFIIDYFGMSNMKGTMKSIILNEKNEVVFDNSFNLPDNDLKKLINKSKNVSSVSAFYRENIEGHDCIVMSKRLTRYSDWRNITYAPLDSSNKEYRHSLNTAIWYIVAAIIILILLSMLISVNISKQFNNLMTYIEKIDISNIKNTSSYSHSTASDDDVHKIYLCLTQMAQKISHQVDEIFKLEESKRLLEIDRLRTQVNPHFVYNTLYLIQSQANEYGAESISSISKALIQLLMYSVTSLDRFVTISQELDNVADYMEIMQSKFSNHTELKTDIESCVRNYTMPKMILQPIVENSMKHGFTDTPGQYVQIKAYEKENEIFISVIDNGKGISAEKIASIFDYSREDSKHLGLKNVDKRLKLTFGESYGIKILSTPNVYTAVMINIPKHSGDDSNNNMKG